MLVLFLILGTSIEVVFVLWSCNQNIDANKFRFTIPKCAKAYYSQENNFVFK